jgi:hypothetical protein
MCTVKQFLSCNHKTKMNLSFVWQASSVTLHIFIVCAVTCSITPHIGIVISKKLKESDVAHLGKMRKPLILARDQKARSRL